MKGEKSYICILVLLAAGVVSSNTIQSTDDVTKGTELVFAFMTHRHADMTPNEDIFPFIGKYALETAIPLIKQFNYNRLTDVGKKTAFKLGQFIRRRYGQLLSPQYDASEIYVRSTDRALPAMTVLTAMAAVYPANHTWNDKLNWNPVPYSTVPAEYDYNLPYPSCSMVRNALWNMVKFHNSRMDPFAELPRTISNAIGLNTSIITQIQPVTVMIVNDIYTSLISSGYEVKDEILALMPAMKEAADEAVDIFYGDDRFLSFIAGPLLNEFFTYAAKIIEGEETQKVRIYSGHDINVYSLRAISRAEPKQGVPKPGSLFSLELRRVVKTGKYVVVPVYLSEPGVEEIYLTVKGCGQLCDFDTFQDITSFYLLREKMWRMRCDIRI